ncbi:MAG: DUF1659 domain-containing protein [Clostridium sp.]
MAVSNVKTSSAINLVYKVGVDEEGKDIMKSQRFSKIKINANDEDIYSVATELGKFVAGDIHKIIKEDKGHLIG